MIQGLVNQINGIQYGLYTPEINPGYDNMFVGLDGNNYAVNGDNAGGSFYTGDTVATFTANATTIPSLPLAKLSGNYLVTKEGNVIYSGANQYCYIKSQGYKPSSIQLGTIPHWIESQTVHMLYQLGKRIYMSFGSTSGPGYWFGINGSNCSIDWDDVRTILIDAYPGKSNYGIYTNNYRVLYGIWYTGEVLYYPYPPLN